MPLAKIPFLILFLSQLLLSPAFAKAQRSTLHLAIGNNGYVHEFEESTQQADRLLILNTFTWKIQLDWKNPKIRGIKELLFENFPIGSYLMYVSYPEGSYNFWKKFTVDAIPESFLTLYSKDTTTTPVDLTCNLKKINDSIKISVSSISCDAHLLDYIILKKTASGILLRKDTYQVEHGPQGVFPIFVCREPSKSTPSYLLSETKVADLNKAFNLSVVAFAGFERYYNYYDCQLGKRHYVSGEKIGVGPLELYLAALLR